MHTRNHLCNSYKKVSILFQTQTKKNSSLQIFIRGQGKGNHLMENIMY